MLNLIIHIVLCFASLAQACNQLHQDSLLSLNFNFNTSSPPLNWSSSIDCCLWEGIQCDAYGHVTHLLVPRRGLTGTISPSIANLTHLSHLNLSHNRLSGPLPNRSFSLITPLQTLDLSYNYLSGQFPSNLSSNNLKFLDLSSNYFHGIIPSSFFQLAGNLMSFNVSNNSFIGPIPSSAWINSLCFMTLLDFSYNEFNGQVSHGLGNCSKLLTFRAGFNNISGSIPYDIYSVTSLQELSLPVNYLSGPISNRIVNLRSLTILDLHSNELSGLIPRDIGKLTHLKQLLLHINNLAGSLPSSMKNCINLTTLNLCVNFLEGDLSAFNFSMLLQLRTLDLGNNKFTGSLPLTLNSCRLLTAIRLSGNQLMGQISPDIVALESLSYLSLSDNILTNITGAMKILMGCKSLGILILSKNFINEAIADDDHMTFSDGFQNLQVLDLGGCQLSGQVPNWIRRLKKLQVLDLSLNKISGSIPGWLGNMPSLFYLDLSHNLISGELPKKLCRLPMLTSEEAIEQVDETYLELPVFVLPNNVFNMQCNKLSCLPPAIYLTNNSLSGSIPFEIGQLKLLHVLDLSHNHFSGNIPNQLSQLTNLEILDLSGNRLSGEIPASLRNLHFLSLFSVANNNLQGLIPSGGQFDTFPISSFEGNPGLCGFILRRLCPIQPTSLPLPRESSNQDLGYGLIAGVVFGFIIGCTSGILCPLRWLKFLQQSRHGRRPPL